MRTITLFIIYFVSFVFLYLLISTIGMFFQSYIETITSYDWFKNYSLFLGWWLSIFPAREYYIAHADYFDKIF